MEMAEGRERKVVMVVVVNGDLERIVAMGEIGFQRVQRDIFC